MKLLKRKNHVRRLGLKRRYFKSRFFFKSPDRPELMMEIGKEFHRRFSGCGITKIFTIESSGIACACLPVCVCMYR